MSFQNNVFQPGTILHEVIAGAMRSQGTTLHDWCKNNGVSWTGVRQVTFGLSAGPRSQAVLDRLINAAGREAVTAAYRIRMDAEARKMAQAARAAA